MFDIKNMPANEDAWIATPASRQARNDRFGVIVIIDGIKCEKQKTIIIFRERLE
jgi:hypothetical protein